MWDNTFSWNFFKDYWSIGLLLTRSYRTCSECIYCGAKSLVYLLREKSTFLLKVSPFLRVDLGKDVYLILSCLAGTNLCFDSNIDVLLLLKIHNEHPNCPLFFFLKDVLTTVLRKPLNNDRYTGLHIYNYNDLYTRNRIRLTTSTDHKSNVQSFAALSYTPNRCRCNNFNHIYLYTYN